MSDIKFSSDAEAIDSLKTRYNDLQREIRKAIVGQDEVVRDVLISIFGNGHCLLVGVPGLAKTLLVSTIGRSLGLSFNRIQFTPDLMPSDVLGTSIFNMKESEFFFKKGPIFSNIVLIDEINRAPAKTQASLFEVMEERQITYDGVEYPMSFPFLVVATQNPVEQEGTYNLPEAQLDRFLFKVKIGYPDLAEEEDILRRYKHQVGAADLNTINPVFSAADLTKIHKVMEEIIVEDHLLKYIAAITHKTRNHGKLFLGASPRASLAMLRAAKAIAAIRGRDFVTPEDIRFVTAPVLNHRLILTPEAEMEGFSSEEIIKEIVESIEVPR